MTLLTTPERRRQQNRESSARARARQRGEDIPRMPGGPKPNPTHFPCGDVRSPANTVMVGTTAKCRTCEQRRRNKNQRAVHAAVKPPKHARTPSPTRKPLIRVSQSPTYLRLMAEAKAEFARQISASRWKPGRRAS